MKNFLSSISKALVPSAGVVLLMLLFSACKKDNKDYNNNIPVAGLMAFNLSPDRSPVSVVLGGSTLTNAPLNYTSFTGVYQPIFPGTRVIEAYDFNSNTAFASTSQNFVADKYYSLFTLGANGTYRNLVVEDELDSLAAGTGEAFVRYVNAVPDSSTSIVTVKSGSNTITNNSAYATVSGFSKVAAGDVTFSVSNGDHINVNRTFTVESKKVYTVLLVGVPANNDPLKTVQIKYVTNGVITP